MKAFILSFVIMMAAALAIQHKLRTDPPVIPEFWPESVGSFTGTGSDDRIISFNAIGFERPPIGENEY